MTPREHAAFNAGILHAASLAQIATVTIEIRDDARHVRQQAAAAALHGLAEGLKRAVKPASGAGLGNAEISGTDSPHGTASAPVLALGNTRREGIREAAIAQGFTGDACDACGSAEMKRSGTCLTCQACGTTIGCG